MSNPSDKVPNTFVRRTTTSVLLIFVVTMAVFLWAAYRSERHRHYEETFEHLEETSGVLSLIADLAGSTAQTDLEALEARLALRTRTPHQVIIVGPDSEIVASSRRSLLGEDIRASLHLVPYGPLESGRAVARDAAGPWLASSVSLDGLGNRLFLLRLREGSEGFVRSFWELHGLHVGITMLLFFVLLKFLGERYVRRPIEKLAGHVQRVEAGEFLTQPERYEPDEFGWLAERFNQMGLRLKETVEQLVRSEKAAAATAVAYQVAIGAMEPLESLKRHITYLQGLAQKDPDLERVATSLEKDRQELVLAMISLEKLGYESLGTDETATRDEATDSTRRIAE